MDPSLIRFKVDPEVLRKAEAVCARHGVDLLDVLRTIVFRIARDQALPTGAPEIQTRDTTAAAPFSDYDPRLWATILPAVDGELALEAIHAAIARLSTQLQEAERSGKSDIPRLRSLRQGLAEARRWQLSLDVTDAESVARILSVYAQPDGDRSAW